MSGAPVLSICIPTYNRADLVTALLAELDEPDYLPFPFEVVVVDNASTDPRYDAVASFQPVHYPYRYYRRPENVGFERNQLSVCRMARGEFCVQLADDDRLIVDELVQVVQALQASPQIVASYALYRLFDQTTNRAAPYQGYEAMLVGSGQVVQLADMLARSKVPIPETAVFRTDLMAHAVFPGAINFGIVAQLRRALMLGPVRFNSQPFYLLTASNLDNPVSGDRASGNLGFEGWSRMARAWAVFNRWATGRVVFDTALTQEQLIYLPFIRNSAYEAQNQGRILEALEIVDHLSSLASTELFQPSYRETLLFPASIEAMVRAIDLLPDIDFLHLVGMPPEIESRIRDHVANLRPTLGIRVSAFPLGLSAEGAAFLTGTDLMREQIIRLHDVLPCAVFSLESLRRAFGY